MSPLSAVRVFASTHDDTHLLSLLEYRICGQSVNSSYVGLCNGCDCRIRMRLQDQGATQVMIAPCSAPVCHALLSEHVHTLRPTSQSASGLLTNASLVPSLSAPHTASVCTTPLSLRRAPHFCCARPTLCSRAPRSLLSAPARSPCCNYNIAPFWQFVCQQIYSSTASWRVQMAGDDSSHLVPRQMSSGLGTRSAYYGHRSKMMHGDRPPAEVWERE